MCVRDGMWFDEKSMRAWPVQRPPTPAERPPLWKWEMNGPSQPLAYADAPKVSQF